MGVGGWEAVLEGSWHTVEVRTSGETEQRGRDNRVLRVRRTGMREPRLIHPLKVRPNGAWGRRQQDWELRKDHQAAGGVPGGTAEVRSPARVGGLDQGNHGRRELAGPRVFQKLAEGTW